MQRFIFGTVSLVILLAVLAFLWIANPLYAFVGAVVFLVFVLVGFGFFLNLSRRKTSPEDEAALKPRRTGQFKRRESLEKPEEAWDDSNMPGNHSVRGKNEANARREPVLSAGASQGFGAGSPKPINSPEPDFDHMTIEELTEWTNTPVPPSESEPAKKDEETRRMDTSTFFSVEVDEEEADDLFAPDLIGEIVEKEMEFDRVADDMKHKMASGTFGNSAEEVEKFFKVAFEKASINNEVPDYIDGIHDEDESEDLPDWLAPASGDSGIIHPDKVIDADLETLDPGLSEVLDEDEVPDWLAEAMNADLAEKDNAIFDNELQEEELASEIAKKDNSSNFDLMGMVGSLPVDKQQEFFALMTEVPIGEQSETQLIRLYEGLAVNKDNQTQISEAQFTAYYPRQASAGTEYGFYVYAHLPDALINADIQAFETQLGGRVPKPKVASDSVKIADDAMLSVIIHCDKLNFNQVGAMQQWKAPFVRFDFRFTANEVQIDEFVEGRIAILMGMIEIASIDFHLGVTPANPLSMLTSVPHDPLSASSFDASSPVSIYQKIFISYSHKDTVFAEQYRKIQTMAGNIIFMDTHSIRAGQDWEIKLKQFIDEADVFQLFWSEHSANSEHVKFEWDYALKQRCPDTACVQFIRPTYWKKPLAQIPNELTHLHFAYVDMETD